MLSLLPPCMHLYIHSIALHRIASHDMTLHTYTTHFECDDCAIIYIDICTHIWQPYSWWSNLFSLPWFFFFSHGTAQSRSWLCDMLWTFAANRQGPPLSLGRFSFFFYLRPENELQWLPFGDFNLLRNIEKKSCSIIELAIGHGFHDKLLNYWKVLMPSFWGWPYRPWWFLELPGFFHRSIHHWKVKTEVPSKIYWDAN